MPDLLARPAGLRATESGSSFAVVHLAIMQLRMQLERKACVPMFLKPTDASVNHPGI